MNNSIEFKNRFMKLPKLGLVKFAKCRGLKGRILNATIQKNSSDKFFLSVVNKKFLKIPKMNSEIGIETDFAILSDGQKIDNNRFTSKKEKKLKREQIKLSRCALLAKQKGKNLFEEKNYQNQK